MHAGGFPGLTADSGARLDHLPLSRYHIWLLTLVGAGMFLDGFELYLTAGVLGALTKNGWSTMSLNAAFVSVTFLGMVPTRPPTSVRTSSVRVQETVQNLGVPTPLAATDAGPSARQRRGRAQASKGPARRDQGQAVQGSSQRALWFDTTPGQAPSAASSAVGTADARGASRHDEPQSLRKSRQCR